MPILDSAAAIAEQGVGPGAIERNWASYGAEVAIDPALPGWAWRLLCDPQTSGGLLVACAPAAAGEVLRAFITAGFDTATRIGGVRAGAGNPRIRVA